MPAPPRSGPCVALALALASLCLSASAAAQRRPPAARPSPVIAVLDRVRGSVRRTRYAHATRIEPAHGVFEFDCSAMAAWVLRQATPRAERTVEHARNTARPLARDYHDFFSAPTDARLAGGGWRRVARLADARPGDVLAWRFPPSIRVAITGHVAFVVAPPRPMPGRPNHYWVRIADATSVPHADDTRAARGASGFGYGTLEVESDPRSGAPVGYRWNQLPGRGLLRAPMALARPLE